MTAGATIRSAPRERRIERGRRSLELLLDTAFRPANWAARLSYALGLQGRIRATESTIRSTVARVRPLRVAFASDFHAGATTDWRQIETACRLLTSLTPDVLLLGGDFVSVRASYIERLAPHLAAIPAPLGKYAVLGNHDLRANSGEVVRALERVGIHMLTNSRATLPPPFADVSIYGLDDPTRGDPRPDLAFDDAGGTRIVLMHSPEGLTHIGERPFDLALCGHTHGGQVAMPNGTPLIVPSGTLNRRFHAGRFDLAEGGRGTLLVSRGVGCSTIPVRLFATPEVHLCLIM
jgi:predicted MPP superfamily phosphohydrolase